MLRKVLTTFSGIPASLSRLGFTVYWLKWLRYVYFAHVKPAARKSLAQIIPLVVVGGGCYLLAGHIYTSSHTKAILTVVSLLLAILFVARVDLALVSMLVLSASIMHASAVPRPFSFGGAGFGTGEMLLIFILFVGVLKAYKNKRHPSSPLTIPLLLFFSSALLGLAVSYRAYLANPRGFFEFSDIYNAGRGVFYYVFFFAILYGIKDKREYRLFFQVSLGLATLVGLMVCAQYILGDTVSLFIGTSTTAGMEEEGVTRIQPPGIPLSLLMFLTTLWLASHHRGRSGMVYLVLAAIMASGIVFSFARNAWISMSVSILLLLLFSPMSVKPRLVGIVLGALVGGILFSFCIGAVSPARGLALRRAVTERFISIFEVRETYESSSIRNRRQENRQTWAVIRQHPVFGVGIGGPIVQKYAVKSTSRGREQAAHSSTIVHNSYLDMWAHYGLLGLLSFAWISLVFFYRALRLWRRAPEIWVKGIGICFALTYLATLMRSVVAMNLVGHLWEITMIAYMWGMVEVASNLYLPASHSFRSSGTDDEKDLMTRRRVLQAPA